MSGSRGFIAEDRALLRVSGEEARDWLQGLVTNDVSRLAPEAAVYAALLTPQGKYLADFFLIEAEDGAVLLDTAAAQTPALLKRLGMYRIRRKVAVEAEAGVGVALVWGGDAPRARGAMIVPDPRSPALGWRLYAADPAAALAEAGASEARRADYDALRVAELVPEAGVELVPEDSYILEHGFDRLNGVDFRKGCYVGQEVTARMRHKTELKKGLARVRLDGAMPPAGCAIETAEGKPAGVLFTVSADGAALAHLRFDRAKGEMRAGGATVIAEG